MSNFFNTEKINDKFEENLKKLGVKISNIEFEMKTYPEYDTAHAFKCEITLSLSFGKSDYFYQFIFESKIEGRVLEIYLTFRLLDSNKYEICEEEFYPGDRFYIHEYERQKDVMYYRDREEDEDEKRTLEDMIDDRWIEIFNTMNQSEFDDYNTDIYFAVKEYVKIRFDTECIINKIKRCNNYLNKNV